MIEPAFFEMIAGDNTFLEREPLENVAAMDELRAYKHDGFWQCMDTKRDKDSLEEMFLKGDALWHR